MSLCLRSSMFQLFALFVNKSWWAIITSLLIGLFRTDSREEMNQIFVNLSFESQAHLSQRLKISLWAWGQ